MHSNVDNPDKAAGNSTSPKKKILINQTNSSELSVDSFDGEIVDMTEGSETEEESTVREVPETGPTEDEKPTDGVSTSFFVQTLCEIRLSL